MKINQYAFYLWLLLTTGLSGVMAQKPLSTAAKVQAKVQINSEAQRRQLGAMGYTGDIYQHHAWLYLSPAEIEKLQKAGYSVQISPTVTSTHAGSSSLVPPGYYTFAQIKNIADSLAANFPAICKKVVFGFNPQFQELAALKISDNVNQDEDEPEVMMDGGIHGDEVGGSQNMILFARDLCLAYGHDPDITSLIDGREIWIYYCVNPYGRDAMTRENSNQVDINRDFGYMWDASGGSPGPFSQVESRCLRDCMNSHQFVSYTNYHSGTEIISYPWSYRYSVAPEKPQFEGLAGIYVENSGYSSLPYGQGSLVMYLIQGSTKDYMYGTQGSVAWSIEISTDKQPAGPNIQHYYNINKPAMIELIRHSADGIRGVVSDAVTGLPVKARISVNNGYPCYSSQGLGDYHKFLVGGTYSVKYMADGYLPVTKNNVVVVDNQTTELNIALQPVCGAYAEKTVMCRIPNFSAIDPGDEGATKACLGSPDSICYSIGKGGYMLVEMHNMVTDGPGDDVKVFENDLDPEGFSLYALDSINGFWNYLGFRIGSGTFDLAVAGLPSSKYFLVLDDNSGYANMDNSGFDFDAIEDLHSPIPDTLAHVSGKISDFATGLGIPGATVKLGDSTLITNSSGYYACTQVRGQRLLVATKTNYNWVFDTLQLQAGHNSEHNYTLMSTDGLMPHILSSSLVVSPNPTDGDITVTFSLDKNSTASIQLLDLQGKVVADFYTGVCTQGKHSVQLPGAMQTIPRGMYLVKLQSTEGIQLAKVVRY